MACGCFNVQRVRTNRVRAGSPTLTNQLRASCTTRDAVNEATGPVFVWVNDGSRRRGVGMTIG